MNLLQDIIASYESVLRASIFIGLFCVMALSEYLKPRRKRNLTRATRWPTNLAIVVLDSLFVRLLFPTAAVGVALWAEVSGFGLLNQLAAPYWLAVLISFVVLDFAVWLSHLLCHKIPLLWRVHRMHHADRDIDVTTGTRFHPIESVASMVWKAGWVALLGAPAASVLLFETVLNGTAMFNHSNTKLPLRVDRMLRLVLVTPDMHRVHHSCIHRETDSNYGFNMPWWDRLFCTYIDQPELGHEGMKIGLDEWQDKRPAQLGWCLKIPFLKS